MFRFSNFSCSLIVNLVLLSKIATATKTTTYGPVTVFANNTTSNENQSTFFANGDNRKSVGGGIVEEKEDVPIEEDLASISQFVEFGRHVSLVLDENGDEMMDSLSAEEEKLRELAGFITIGFSSMSMSMSFSYSYNDLSNPPSDIGPSSLATIIPEEEESSPSFSSKPITLDSGTVAPTVVVSAATTSSSATACSELPYEDFSATVLIKTTSRNPSYEVIEKELVTIMKEEFTFCDDPFLERKSEHVEEQNKQTDEKAGMERYLQTQDVSIITTTRTHGNSNEQYRQISMDDSMLDPRAFVKNHNFFIGKVELRQSNVSNEACNSIKFQDTYHCTMAELVIGVFGTEINDYMMEYIFDLVQNLVLENNTVLEVQVSRDAHVPKGSDSAATDSTTTATSQNKALASAIIFPVLFVSIIGIFLLLCLRHCGISRHQTYVTDDDSISNPDNFPRSSRRRRPFQDKFLTCTNGTASYVPLGKNFDDIESLPNTGSYLTDDNNCAGEQTLLD